MSGSARYKKPGSAESTMASDTRLPTPRKLPSWPSSWFVEMAPIRKPTTAMALPVVLTEVVTADTVAATASLRPSVSRNS